MVFLRRRLFSGVAVQCTIVAMKSNSWLKLKPPREPVDLAATIYHHFGIPLDTAYTDDRQWPIYAGLFMNRGPNDVMFSVKRSCGYLA